MQFLGEASLEPAAWSDNRHWPSLTAFQIYETDRQQNVTFDIPVIGKSLSSYFKTEWEHRKRVAETQYIAVLVGFAFRVRLTCEGLPRNDVEFTFEGFLDYSTRSALPLSWEYRPCAAWRDLVRSSSGAVWFTRGEVWGMTEDEWDKWSDDGFYESNLDLVVAGTAAKRRQARERELAKAASTMATESRLRTQVSRDSIPRDVRLFVWQRDRGVCVDCGSNANLEFDHIIPVAWGGSSSERNLQLLCQLCNRRKGANIT